jgi:hypothetical protein
MTSTVPAAKLAKLTTAALIEQYEIAVADRVTVFAAEGSKHGGHSPKQKRVDRIVDLLSTRADQGDADALAWF